jgi:TolB-like protein
MNDASPRSFVGRVFAHVAPVIGGKITGGVIVDGLIALTGFGPEHWFAWAFSAMHLSERIYLPGGIDMRVALVALGVMVIVGDAAWHRRKKAESPAAVSLSEDADGASTLPSDANAPSIPLALPDRPSIAVLPFQNMSGDLDQDYFVDGMVEDIITALSRFGSLFVIARNSSFTYKGRAINVKQVGRELGVRYVLEGSVRRVGGKVRITGQLIEAATNGHLWAEKFDGDLHDVFDLQDRITTSVVSAIAPALEQAEFERIRHKPTGQMDSYDHYLRGMAFTYAIKLPEAYEAFEQAITLDENYAAAYSMAAQVILRGQSLRGALLPPEKRAKAVELAHRALALGQNDAAALARAAHAVAFLAGEYERAEAAIEQAFALNPNLSDVWNYGGWVAIICGDGPHAYERFNRVLRLSPLDPLRRGIWYGISCACNLLGRYEEGYAAALRARQQWKEVHSCGAIIINAIPTGRIAEANTALADLLTLRPDFTLKDVSDVFRTRDPAWMKLVISYFRDAGLPEQ